MTEREELLESVIRKYALMVEECEGVDFISDGCREKAARAGVYGRAQPFTDAEWAELVRLTEVPQ